jgi:hypothetical protein
MRSSDKANKGVVQMHGPRKQALNDGWNKRLQKIGRAKARRAGKAEAKERY